MQITVLGETRNELEGIMLKEVMEKYMPYGEEAVICVHNGNAHKSIDIPDDIVVSEGDVVDIVPLIIGG